VWAVLYVRESVSLLHFAVVQYPWLAPLVSAVLDHPKQCWGGNASGGTLGGSPVSGSGGVGKQSAAAGMYTRSPLMVRWGHSWVRRRSGHLVALAAQLLPRPAHAGKQILCTDPVHCDTAAVWRTVTQIGCVA
jgi:hypothetical protein